MLLRYCKKCSVFDEKGENFIFAARVSVQDDGTMYLYFSDWDMKAEPNFRSMVTFYDSAYGLVTGQCDIAVRPNLEEGAEPFQAVCTIGSVEQVVQRKEDFRVSANLLVCLAVPKGRSHYRTVEAVIKNLSAGGMFINCTYPFTPGDTFLLEFTYTKRPLHLRAHVLRVDELKPGLYGYGCQFIHLTGGAESALRRYVYQLEVKGRRFRPDME